MRFIVWHYRRICRRSWWRSCECSLAWYVAALGTLRADFLRWRRWWREKFADRQIHLDDSVVSNTERRRKHILLQGVCSFCGLDPIAIVYLSYGYFESISSTMDWKRHGMSVRLPHLAKCLSVNASMAVKAKWVTSLICVLRGKSGGINNSIIKYQSGKNGPPKHLQYEANARCDAALWLSLLLLLLLASSLSSSSSSSSSALKKSWTCIMLFDWSFGRNNNRQISATNLMNFLNRINLISSFPSVNRSNLNLNLSSSQCSSLGALCTIGRGGGP